MRGGKREGESRLGVDSHFGDQNLKSRGVGGFNLVLNDSRDCFVLTLCGDVVGAEDFVFAVEDFDEISAHCLFPFHFLVLF